MHVPSIIISTLVALCVSLPFLASRNTIDAAQAANLLQEVPLKSLTGVVRKDETSLLDGLPDKNIDQDTDLTSLIPRATDTDVAAASSMAAAASSLAVAANSLAAAASPLSQTASATAVAGSATSAATAATATATKAASGLGAVTGLLGGEL